MINQENWNYCFYENADGQIASLSCAALSDSYLSNDIKELYNFNISMSLENQKIPLILFEESFELLDQALFCLNALPQSYPEDSWFFVDPTKTSSCCSKSSGCSSASSSSCSGCSSKGGKKKCCAQKRKRN